jgi:hypothetical protein
LTPQDHAAVVAIAAVTRLGQSTLGAQLAGHFARFDICFQTYEQLRRVVKRPDGREYHVESIGRKVRQLQAQQIVSHRRVMPGVVPRRAKKRAWNGTTENSLIWKAIQARTPLSRAERRKARIEHERQLGAVERERRRGEREAEVAFLKRLSGDVTPPPEPTYRQAIDALVSETIRAQDARAARRARASVAAGDGAGRVPTPPPAATGPPE